MSKAATCSRMPAHRRHRLHGPQVARMAMHQGWRQQATAASRVLRAVDVGHAPPPASCMRCSTPASMRCRPRARSAAGTGRSDQGRCGPSVVGVDVVGDAVVANLALQAAVSAGPDRRWSGLRMWRRIGAKRLSNLAALLLESVATTPRSSSRCPTLAPEASAWVATSDVASGPTGEAGGKGWSVLAVTASEYASRAGCIFVMRPSGYLSCLASARVGHCH
jgi:hypothetical protein